jgi:ankyrin repeat protein
MSLDKVSYFYRFRWVYCQLEALRHSLAPSLRKILEDLPDTLDETYERVLREINKANREHAHRLLQCLTVAHRPLRVEELAEVLAIDFEAPAHGGIPQPNPNWRWADHHEAVLSTCSSLIAIVDEGDSQVVQFSHFSVKEYLTSDRLSRSSDDISRYRILLEPANTVLAQACVAALLRLNDHVNRETAGDIPLVNYAARYWFDHARFEGVSSNIQDAMEYFFDADKPHWAAWCQVQTIDEWWGWFTPDEGDDHVSPLYYASLGGFYDVAERLVDKHPDDINSRGGLLITPLVAALRGKHFDVANLLHRHGAYLDVQDNGGHTPLHESCRTGVLDIVKWLLERGADADALCCKLYSPVHVSADNGSLQALKLLIVHNANIDIKTVHGKRPLHVAASPNVQRDHVEIMQLLLDKGADPNARDKNGSTPLHHSSWWKRAVGYPATQGTVEGTRLLIMHGADVNAEDNEGRTPMQVALENGRDDMATCLSENGAMG